MGWPKPGRGSSKHVVGHKHPSTSTSSIIHDVDLARIPPSVVRCSAYSHRGRIRIFRISSWFVFLLPCYSTFKALSRAPVPGELEVICMYWAVIGAFTAAENTVGPFVSWSVSLFSVFWRCPDCHQASLLLGAQDLVLALSVSPANTGSCHCP